MADSQLFHTMQTPSFGNPDFGQLVEPDFTIANAHTFPAFDGVKVDMQPVQEPAEARAPGSHLHMFAFLDFYNRIHVTPLSISLGNIVSNQERDISVWNAYFEPHTLEDIETTAFDGLTLSEPAPTPLVYGPLQERIYTLSVITQGPPTVEAELLFEFDSIDIVVPITGVRIVAWTWEANWQQPVVEKPEWVTDVIESENGNEQRRQLRAAPRVTWEFQFDIEGDQRRFFENVIYAWGARVWAVPVMQDLQYLTQGVAAGLDVIPAQTEGYDFREDGLAILIYNGKYESIEVQSITPTQLTIHRPLAFTWPRGTRLYPARSARMLDPRAFGRPHRNYVQGTARFKSVEEIALPELTDEHVYRGYPVMAVAPNWRDAPEIDYRRKLIERSFGTGQDDIRDIADIPLPVQTWRWTALSRADAVYMKRWLWTRRGRARAIWVPTFAEDMVLLSTISISSSLMVLKAAGLVHFAAGGVHRRDVRIKLHDGTVFYRRLSDFVTIDDESERVTMNAPLGREVRPDEIEAISWLTLLRLDTDGPEIAWQTAGVAETTIIMKGPRNDV
jgi:hypothetical protein